MEKLHAPDFSSPAILLGGPVDYDMYKNFGRSWIAPKKKAWSSPNCRRLAEIRKWPA